MTSKIADKMPISLESGSSPDSHMGETVVLLITTHGALTAEEYQQNVNYFNLPSGITLKRVLVSTPGVCNLLSDADTDRFAEMISTSLDGLINGNNETQNQTINDILGSIVKYDTSTLNETKSEIKKLNQKQKKNNISEEDSLLLEDSKSYITHFNKSFNFNTFSDDEPVIDKFYTRDDLEARGNNWVIKVIGSSKPELKGMDLMTLLSPPTEESNESSITLEEIVDFLKDENDVKTIIIFDFSCSVIYTPDARHPTDRAIRRLRRDTLPLTLKESKKGSKKGSKKNVHNKRKDHNKRKYHNKLKMGGKTKKKKLLKKNTKRRK